MFVMIRTGALEEEKYIKHVWSAELEAMALVSLVCTEKWVND